jgi:hypothetical protein
VDYFSLYNAWRSCRRRKRATPQAQFYEAYLLDNLIETVHALRSGHWHPCRPVCFMVDKPKAREIHAAHYRDRVVHHWLVPRLEELYEPIFIHDVYSNRKGKGTHTAVKRLQHFMRGVSRREEGGMAGSLQAGARKDESRSGFNPTLSLQLTPAVGLKPDLRAMVSTECIRNNDVVGNVCSPAGAGSYGNIDYSVGARPCGRTGRNPAGGFFLQLDIKNFFNSVDRRILFSLLQKRLCKAVRQGKLDEKTAVSYRDISHIILKQEVGKEAFMAATPAELARIPDYKRLINAGKDKGLPIGNLTSQFFANVYLNELDQFIKHDLKCHHYLRFVDDFVLLHRDPEQLRRWHGEIEKFLMERLGLELKKPMILQPVQQGANFLGYIVRPDYLLVRQRVVGNLWEKLIRFEKQWIKGDENRGWTLILLREPREHLRSVLASYWGHFKHADHYRLARKVFTRFPWLSCLFDLRNDRFIPLWQPVEVTGYKSQQRFFQRQFPHAEVRIQRGCQFDKVGVKGDMTGKGCIFPACTPLRGDRVPLNGGGTPIVDPGSHAPHGNPTAPVLQVREHHENQNGMSHKLDAAHPGCVHQRRMGTRNERIVGNVCSPVGARPCGRTGLRQSTDQHHQINPRLAVSKVIVRQQGYLKGGLRRRCIESIIFLPSSQTGVSLCASFAP